jgi:hypothetical protein
MILNLATWTNHSAQVAGFDTTNWSSSEIENGEKENHIYGLFPFLQTVGVLTRR